MLCCACRIQLKVPSDAIAAQIHHMKNLEEKLSGFFTGTSLITLFCHYICSATHLSHFLEWPCWEHVEEMAIKCPFPS